MLEVVKAICHEFAIDDNGYIILSGVEHSISGSTFSVTEGWVLWDWEPLYCPAQSITVSNPLNDVEVLPDTTYDPAGNKIFADGVGRDTYRVKNAKIQEGTLGGQIILGQAPRLMDKIEERLLGRKTDVTITIFYNGFAPTTNSFAKAEKMLGQVRLSGHIGGGNTGNDAFQIPSGYRPAQDLIFVAPMSVAPYNCRLIITASTGIVTVLADGNPVLGSSDYIGLNGVSYFV